MWVQFFVRRTPDPEARFILDKYQIDGEDPITLPQSVSTTDTTLYILGKAKMSEEEMLEKGGVRINMKMTEFQERIAAKIAEGALPHTNVPATQVSVEGMMSQLMELQRQQARQQQELLQIVMGSAAPQPRFELVKPDIFDGTCSSPQSWISFYEYACDKNRWTTDEDKITNLRLFLKDMAKSWFELRIPNHAKDSWELWKENFLSSFQENAVDRWDRAISFKYQSGSPLAYFYEKRRLLQMADPALPDTSTVPLLVLGMPRDLQRQVQVKNPIGVESLLQCCRELCVDHHPRDRFPRGEQDSRQGHRSGSNTYGYTAPVWRQGGQPGQVTPNDQSRTPRRDNHLNYVREDEACNDIVPQGGETKNE